MRISKEKLIFSEAAEYNFCTEIFRIFKVIHRRPRVVYELEDLNGTTIVGQFYSEELTPIRITSRTTYKKDKYWTIEGCVAFEECSSAANFTVETLSLGSRQIALRVYNMMSCNRIYVTLFSNASLEIYENNNHADLTVKLSRPIDLGTSPILEMGVCEV